jgi:hypothetical protein
MSPETGCFPRWEDVRVSVPSGDDLTPIDLLVLNEAGGDNTIGNAYGAVQLYRVFAREEDLNDATESALLRLFDRGLVRFVKSTHDVGYGAKRHELPALTREQLVAYLKADFWGRDVDIWYDPTPEGEALLEGVPKDRIPQVPQGNVPRPWLE